MAKTSIGGQAVLEGVMMRSKEKSALAVRKQTGQIVTKKWDNKVRDSKAAKFPVVRGVINFIDMMIAGVSTITDSAKMFDETAEDVEPGKFEKFIAKKTGKSAMDVMMIFAVIVGIALAVGLFFILPTIITGWIKGSVENAFLINLIDGGVRICIFLAYMLLVRLMKDIKRVFMYHGAEHKTIHCFEAEKELTVENVRAQSRLHPRCGTSFLLLIMVVTIILYSLLGWSGNVLVRFGTRLLLLPVIAGLSYEFLKLAAKSDNIVCRILRWPGLQLQRITTSEPDDSMIECAIVAFKMVERELSEEETAELANKYDRSKKPEKPEASEEADTAPEAAEDTGSECTEHQQEQNRDAQA